MEGRERVVALARRLMAGGIAQYGMSETRAGELIPFLVDEGVNDELFARMEALTGNAALFARPVRILEFGCGSGAFTYSALQRGHDAHGIDNDPDRLAIAYAKIDAYGYPDAWRGRVRLGDAMRLDFPSETFDVVMGWQVIEHIPWMPAALFEAVRVLKPGGLLFFWAPDYRAPYEAHYEMPWPPFASPEIAREWVIAMGRPTGGIGTFFNISLPQVHAVLEALGCRVFAANIDRPIPLAVSRILDVSTPSALRDTAGRMRSGMENGALPPELTSPTSMTIAARKSG